MGKRYSWDDPELQRLVQGQRDMLFSFQSAFTFSFLGQYIPHWILKKMYPETVEKILSLIRPAREYVREKIVEHRESFDPNNLRDFMDQYMKHRSGDPEFTESKFVRFDVVVHARRHWNSEFGYALEHEVLGCIPRGTG